jgi:hypothetical protein
VCLPLFRLQHTDTADRVPREEFGNIPQVLLVVALVRTRRGPLDIAAWRNTNPQSFTSSSTPYSGMRLPPEEDSSTASPTQSAKSTRLSVMPDPSLIAYLFKSILPPVRQGLGVPDRG